jgi:hypothetical protein
MALLIQALTVYLPCEIVRGKSGLCAYTSVQKLLYTNTEHRQETSKHGDTILQFTTRLVPAYTRFTASPTPSSD